MHRIFTLISVGLLLGGCTLKTAYNQLDWVMASYIEDVVTLSDSQEAELEKRLKSTLKWHRQSQLPEYANWLKTIRSDVDKGLTVPIVESHFETLELFWRRMVNRGIQDMVVLLPDLNLAQRQEILAKLNENNSEFLESFKNVNHEELKDERYYKIEENFERWLGPLSQQQLDMISDYMKISSALYQERYQARLYWHNKFSALLLTDTDKTTLKQNLESLFLYPERHRTDKYQQKIQQNIHAFSVLVVNITSVMTQAQKMHLFDELDDFQQIFTELSVETVD